MAKRKKRRRQHVAPSDPPVRPGVVGLGRQVPDAIIRPPYARVPGGEPGPSRSPLVRTVDELANMRTTGVAAAEVLLIAGAAVRPGITTDQLDAIVHEETLRRGGYPSPLGYRGFPKSTCTSVNEVICHGIPDSRQLAEGDLVNIDVTVFLNGVHGDTNCTFFVGEPSDQDRLLVEQTRVAMYAGIESVHDGSRVNDIGRAIEAHAKHHQLGVVEEFIGHGVGTEFHGGLQIPHYFEPRAMTQLATGMTFTIEPMLTLGEPQMYIWDDDWTAVTADGCRTAQFEHTLVVTGDGSDLLTVTPSGECAADRHRVGASTARQSV